MITTDGTTLLGGDDKAGIAVITAAAAFLVEHPEIEHGPIRLLFTCDEEIGHGTDHVDLEKLAATVAYTLDGAGANDIDVETFSADLAVVTIDGKNIHPSIAKGRMVNALRAAGDFISRLPREGMSPETTADREGFIHPYHIEGSVEQTMIRLILRDFQVEKLVAQAELLGKIAKQVEIEYPGTSLSVNITKQYRNMGSRTFPGSAGSSIRRGGPSSAWSPGGSGDCAWWYRWLTIDRTWTSDSQSVFGTAQSPFAVGMGLLG